MDSEKTKAVFEKGLREMEQALDEGHVVDGKVMEIAMQGVRNHLIAKNNEVKEKMYNLTYARTVNPQSIEGLKETLKQLNS